LLLDAWFLTQSSARWLAERVPDSPLSPDEFGLCTALAAVGSVTASQVADLTGLTISTVASMMSRLGSRGVLTSEPHPSDRRARLWSFTEDGRRAFDDIEARFHSSYRRLIAAMTPELAASARAGMIALDDGLRADLGLAARPRPAVDHVAQAQLTLAEQLEVRQFEAWLVHRRTRDAGGAP
jgi:DNA-binding MarR family transcriptional regulator